MRHLIKYILIILFVHVSKAQTETKAVPLFNIEGQLAITTNGKALWYNMGGPSIKFNFKKVSFSLGMFPSLKFEQDESHPIVVPILGVGLQLYFLNNKRFVMSFPCYYLAAKNSWELTGGIGYVLTKIKK